MQITKSTDERLWKRCVQDALFELDPQTLREKLEAADKAIAMRRLELTSCANPDSLELAELMHGLNTLHTLGFLKNGS